MKDQWDSVTSSVGDVASIKHEIHGNPIERVKWRVKSEQKVDDLGEFQHFFRVMFSVMKYSIFFVVSDDHYYAEHADLRDKLFFNPSDLSPHGELLVLNAQKSDRQEYVMIVENDYGSTNVTTLLRVKCEFYLKFVKYL